jgi:uncharacterized membrane protein YgcG
VISLIFGFPGERSMRFVVIALLGSLCSGGFHAFAEEHSAGGRPAAEAAGASGGGRRTGESRMAPARLEFLARVFDMPLRVVEKKYDEPLYRALDKVTNKQGEDDVATLIARWYGTIGTKQLPGVLEAVRKEKDDESKKDPKDERWLSLLSRILWAAPIATGDEPVKKPEAEAFNAAFKEAWEKVKEANRQFHEKLAQARTNDKAREALLKSVDPDLVMAFLAAQAKRGDEKLAKDLAQALALEGGNGQKFLDLIGGQNAEAQRLYLGKTPEEALKTIQVASDRLGNFGNTMLAPKQHENPAKNWYVKSDGSWNVGIPEGGAPAAPNPNGNGGSGGGSSGGGSSGGGSSGGGGSGGFAAVVATIQSQTCTRCHGGGSTNPLNLTGDGANVKLRGLPLRTALEKALSIPDMVGLQATIRDLLKQLQ